MRQKLAVMVVPLAFLACLLAFAPAAVGDVPLLYNGKTNKVSVSYALYDSDKGGYVFNKAIVAEPKETVSNGVVGLAYSGTVATFQQMVNINNKAFIIVTGTLLQKGRGYDGEGSCGGYIPIDSIYGNDLTYDGVNFTGSGIVLYFEGSCIIKEVSKLNSSGFTVGTAKVSIVPSKSQMFLVTDGVMDPTPVKTMFKIKLAPTKFVEAP